MTHGQAPGGQPGQENAILYARMIIGETELMEDEDRAWIYALLSGGGQEFTRGDVNRVDGGYDDYSRALRVSEQLRRR